MCIFVIIRGLKIREGFTTLELLINYTLRGTVKKYTFS
jgi:hypothetical protein